MDTTTTIPIATFSTQIDTENPETFVDYTKLGYVDTRNLLDRVNYALLRISTKGWIKLADRSDYSSPDTSKACLVGSFIMDEEMMAMRMLQSLGNSSPIRRSTESALGMMRQQLSSAVIPQYLRSIGVAATNATNWNDATERTQEEVVKVLIGLSNVLSAQLALLKPLYFSKPFPTRSVRITAEAAQE